MRKRWVAAVGMALAAPAAAQGVGAAHPPQQASQSQAEYERGIHRLPPGHQDPGADAARRMESTEQRSRAAQPALAAPGRR